MSRNVNILIWDIETTPVTGRAWGKWNVNLLEVIEPSHILCFAYRWYGDTETTLVSQRDFKRDFRRNRKDDRRVAQAAWDLFEKADIIVAQNGVRFDTKKMNDAFLRNGLTKPSPFKQVDTLAVSRRHFASHSQSLQDVAERLGIGSKLQNTGYKLWQDCMAGDPEAWDLMERYNVQDVDLLLKVYERYLLDGWIDTHPNMGLLSENRMACRACGKDDKMVKRGTYYATTCAYQKFQCGHCNTYSKLRKAGTGPQYS